MIKKILSNTLYLASLLVSHVIYPIISSVELLQKTTPEQTTRVVIINDFHPGDKIWPTICKKHVTQMNNLIKQLNRKQTPTQLYVELAKKNIERCDITNKKMLDTLKLTATGILYLNALKQLKDKNKKDQKNVIYNVFDSRDDLDFNTLRLFSNPPISSKKTVESSNNDTDDSKPISVANFIEKYKRKRDSLFIKLATLREEHKKQESKDIFNKFDNLFSLLRTCNEVLKEKTLPGLVSKLYKIHYMQKQKSTKYFTIEFHDQIDTGEGILCTTTQERFNVDSLNAIDTTLRAKLKLDKEKTIFEQLKKSYYSVNSLIPITRLLYLFSKHQSTGDTFVVQCDEMYGKNFAKKLRDYYGFKDHSLSKKLRTKHNFDRTPQSCKDYIPVIPIPLVSFEKEILDFLELHPTLMEKIGDRVMTRKAGGIFLILLAAASGGYYWLNSDAPNED